MLDDRWKKYLVSPNELNAVHDYALVATAQFKYRAKTATRPIIVVQISSAFGQISKIRRLIIVGNNERRSQTCF